LFKLLVDYPAESEEAEMMVRWGQVTTHPELHAVSSGEELLAIRAEVDRVHVSSEIQSYILTLVRATRTLADREGTGRRLLSFGASPRASLALFLASRALAWLRGMDYVTPALVQDVFLDCLRHRVGLTYEAEADELTADKVLSDVLKSTVPAARAA
jgi:MoxR-like ATPase